MDHKTITGVDLHVPGYLQSGDPGAVGAGKYWIDTTAGAGLWVLKVRNVANTGWETVGSGGGGGGAPTTADYLVGTANAGLSAEIVVGTAPGGELGGSWASPTVDASHSGSTHAATQAAAEATASGALTTHGGAANPHTVYQLAAQKGVASGYASLDSGVLVPAAQLGTGTPDGTKYLRDDRTWALIPIGATGPAGGALGGTYPNPSVDDDGHNHTSATVTTHSTAHAHSALTGVGVNDHHTENHASRHLAAGADPLAIPNPTINIYTSGTGNWSKPAGARYVRVRLVGGGGGGGGAAATAAATQASASGGGGGGYVEKTYAASALGSTEAYAVGAAGTAGAAGVNNGGTGGASTFSSAGNLLTGSGGTGGEGAAASGSGPGHVGGNGGAASGGDLNSVGSDGFSTKLNVGIVVAYGAGGGSFLGGSVLALHDVAAKDGKAYGGGGAGAASGFSQSARAGGAGAVGVVIVETYF